MCQYSIPAEHCGAHTLAQYRNVANHQLGLTRCAVSPTSQHPINCGNFIILHGTDECISCTYAIRGKTPPQYGIGQGTPFQEQWQQFGVPLMEVQSTSPLRQDHQQQQDRATMPPWQQPHGQPGIFHDVLPRQQPNQFALQPATGQAQRCHYQGQSHHSFGSSGTVAYPEQRHQAQPGFNQSTSTPQQQHIFIPQQGLGYNATVSREPERSIAQHRSRYYVYSSRIPGNDDLGALGPYDDIPVSPGRNHHAFTPGLSTLTDQLSDSHLRSHSSHTARQNYIDSQPPVVPQDMQEMSSRECGQNPPQGMPAPQSSANPSLRSSPYSYQPTTYYQRVLSREILRRPETNGLSADLSRPPPVPPRPSQIEFLNHIDDLGRENQRLERQQSNPRPGMRAWVEDGEPEQ